MVKPMCTFRMVFHDMIKSGPRALSHPKAHSNVHEAVHVVEIITTALKPTSSRLLIHCVGAGCVANRYWQVGRLRASSYTKSAECKFGARVPRLTAFTRKNVLR